ncbi:MAG: insulinase family protein [Acidobacteria bacterium]|nr:insulinase family protein [Acidobacteriota bacterium]
MGESHISIPFARHVLDNGLVILVHEDHRCPIVAVNLWYHIGSKDELPGRTGFAHLFEHLMFEGSEHHDSGYFQPLQQAGAAVNGSTNTDRTNYWEVVPTSALDLALWLESDRMGHLLPALTEARFSTQREVVLNERRQNYENRPYGLATQVLVAALFPPGHPCHWLTIGHPEDLRAAGIDDVRAFFARHYHPRNASLALAGDIDTEEAIQRAASYFGAIPAGAPDATAAPMTPAVGDVRLTFEDRVELPRLYLGWHAPQIFASGDAELDLLADVLAGGKSSRLYRALVYERRLATEVAAAQNSRQLGSFFSVVATAAPGHGLDEIDQAIMDEIGGLVTAGPTAGELERSLAQAEAHFIYRLQSVGGFGGKADQLNAYEMYVGDPGYIDRDWQRYQQATIAAIRDAGAAALAPRARVAVSVVPRGRLDLAVAGSAQVKPS